MDKAACANKGAAQRRLVRGPVMEAAHLLNQLYTCALGPALTNTCVFVPCSVLHARYQVLVIHYSSSSALVASVYAKHLPMTNA